MMDNNETTETIAERFGNRHNPVLRWTPGVRDTLRIESRFTPCSDGEQDVCEFVDVCDFCDAAGYCTPDTALTDAEWLSVLDGMAHA